ncbi:hypothetical protein D1AOALGA4SA_12545 [Olavius algarvensis Delta 1 endosymbiont]|nr:hypothetical protein D1AOALGA4SA_12545 [Olavius algarvensis Delta 1 endosymbiont]
MKKKYFSLYFTFCLLFAFLCIPKSNSYAENNATFGDLLTELGINHIGYPNEILLSEIPENTAIKVMVSEPLKNDLFFGKSEWVEITKVVGDIWEIKNPSTGTNLLFSFKYENSKLQVFKISTPFDKKNNAVSKDSVWSEEDEFTAVSKESAFSVETEFTLSGGYRRDDLDWNIGLPDHNINVLSELTWDDLESYQVKFQGSLVWPNIIALRGLAGYGWIFDGDNQDSDFAGNDRTFEFSRSNNSADDGDAWDVSIAVGYPFRTGKDVIGTITPLVGYSHHEQNLKMSDGVQTIATPGVTPPLGPFEGLDSSYDTEWYGLWVGIDMNFRAAEIDFFDHRFEVFFSYEYHWADYEAEADWNLRDDLQHPRSFTHDADGNGWIIRTGFNFVLKRNIALNFNYDYQDWSTDRGTDKIFFADGTTAKTRLNEVNWTSYAISLGIAWRF